MEIWLISAKNYLPSVHLCLLQSHTEVSNSPGDLDSKNSMVLRSAPGKVSGHGILKQWQAIEGVRKQHNDVKLPLQVAVEGRLGGSVS